MSRPSKPVFLERQGYRRRRLADAARLLPIFGAALFAFPLLWPSPKPGVEVAGPDGVPMSTAYLYVYGIWFGLIVLTALFGMRVRRGGDDQGPHGPGAL